MRRSSCQKIRAREDIRGLRKLTTEHRFETRPGEPPTVARLEFLGCAGGGRKLDEADGIAKIAGDRRARPEECARKPPPGIDRAEEMTWCGEQRLAVTKKKRAGQRDLPEFVGSVTERVVERPGPPAEPGPPVEPRQSGAERTRHRRRVRGEQTTDVLLRGREAIEFLGRSIPPDERPVAVIV